MQDVVAPVSYIQFDIEASLEMQIGALPLPFPGMDKSGAAICTYYLSNICSKGAACPFRHVKGDRTVVCKHWLRGLCKKGDDCEFLHEYDMTKMPECYFFSKFGECNNRECPFLHIDPSSKLKDCAWYDRGFCRHGPNCKNRHVRRVICQCYLNGFCLDGPKCKFMHPKFELPVYDNKEQVKKALITCHFCGETGHKAVSCFKVQQGQIPVSVQDGNKIETQPQIQSSPQVQTSQPSIVSSIKPLPDYRNPMRPLDQVTCFKCGEKGHYANKCTKGHLAFLSAGNH